MRPTRKSNRRNKRKTQKGGINANLANLLKANFTKNNIAKETPINSINSIKRSMKRYIASPWDAVSKKITEPQQYKNQREEYKKEFGVEKVDKKALCQTQINSSNSRYPWQQKLCQSHSGNLFEHSQWSALQIVKWSNDKDPIMDGVNLRTAIVSAFFHDIGKGGDCVISCGNTCWLDMYANAKYNRKGDGIHPTYSGDMILGKIPFIPSCIHKERTISIKTVIEKTYPDISIKEVALAAFMHWEFGKLNIPGKPESEKISIYLKNFKESCDKCNLTPNDTLLRLCIAVACADISAGTNRRLNPSINGIVPAEEVFIGKDPWIMYGMDVNYLKYRQQVLDVYNSK
jgi:hypothetical protein